MFRKIWTWSQKKSSTTNRSVQIYSLLFLNTQYLQEKMNLWVYNNHVFSFLSIISRFLRLKVYLNFKPANKTYDTRNTKEIKPRLQTKKNHVTFPTSRKFSTVVPAGEGVDGTRQSKASSHRAAEWDTQPQV